ncbi:MAG: hypothetical protein IJZ55_08535 [Lachnospiraceae bacterium]|nr:hypothetical protein [Lachnospiraceae bacterium]
MAKGRKKWLVSGSLTKKGMRRIVIGFLILSVMVFAGCSKEKAGEEDGKKNVGIRRELEPLDYNRGQASTADSQMVMVTEKGYYYYNPREFSGSNETMGLRYVDAETGTDIFLCNKPECRHDGNQFCSATNKKYEISATFLYGDRIYAVATEETDTQYLQKLLSVTLDGSELNEELTIYTLEKTGGKWFGNCYGFLIHRNTAIIGFGFSAAEVEPKRGTAIVDLNTGDVVYLDEEPLSEENIGVNNLNAYGDTIYYCKKEGKKNVLYRYHITDGTVDSCELLPGFNQKYAVLDEDTIVYMKSSKRAICVYRPSTGENTEHRLLETELSYGEDGEKIEKTVEYEGDGIKTDGTYLYVPQQRATFREFGRDFHFVIHVFDRNLKEIAVVDVGPSLEVFHTDTGEEVVADAAYWREIGEYVMYLGEDIYFLSYIMGTNLNYYVHHCKRSDLLAGNPQLEFLFGMK